MSLLFPDKVKVTNVVRNTTFKTETESDPFTSEAYVLEKNSNDRGINGITISHGTIIGLPKNTKIYEGDYIRIIKLHGENITTSHENGKRMKVSKINRIGAYRTSHLIVGFESGNR